MFKKILIANRGEIALRVIRTCRQMGIKTVAVYSDADTNALHVTAADEAYYIGPSPSDQSYLVIENVLDACRVSGAQAVHPGYGFLSENADFAKALAAENITFIGPPVEAIYAMGDKIRAKKHAEEAGVNTIPGYEGEIESPELATEVANNIGYPVMLKAAAGGGGKGMRIVKEEAEIKQAFSSTRNEARKNFSDDRVFIEKFIEDPRHIEIQLMADKYGNILCLGERECSIQRHHQKVIEEAPSPVMDDATRQAMYEQSVALAKRVGYFSAGTMEFIMDQEKNFYFLEMNTRLQVEHPVTEYVTGLDLVELMIRVAYGQPLPLDQKDVILKGHAIECRVYAEDPERSFLPSTGRITQYQEPKKGGNVRVDSGVYAGGEVSMFYDAMIAKLITYGKNRTEAIKTMQESLGQYVIAGVSHNISFLEALMENERFRSGHLSTHFIAEEYPGGFSGAELSMEKTRALIAVGLFIYLKDAERATTISGQARGRSRQIGTRWVVSVDDDNYPVNVRRQKDGYDVEYGEQRFGVYSNWVLGSRLFQGTVSGRPVNVRIAYTHGGYILTHAGSRAKVTARTPRVAELTRFMPLASETLGPSVLTAPISGIVVELKVKEGDIVSPGQELLVLEAMKMENMLYAEKEGIIKSITATAGESVQVNDLLIEFEKPEEAKDAA